MVSRPTALLGGGLARESWALRQATSMAPSTARRPRSMSASTKRHASTSSTSSTPPPSRTGRPTPAPPQGRAARHRRRTSTALDEIALRDLIATGQHYYRPARRLLEIWARAKVDRGRRRDQPAGGLRRRAGGRRRARMEQGPRQCSKVDRRSLRPGRQARSRLAARAGDSARHGAAVAGHRTIQRAAPAHRGGRDHFRRSPARLHARLAGPGGSGRPARDADGAAGQRVSAHRQEHPCATR